VQLDVFVALEAHFFVTLRSSRVDYHFLAAKLMCVCDFFLRLGVIKF
jgi:hypothetical protein